MTESAWTETIKPLLGSNYEVDRLWKEHQALEAQLAELDQIKWLSAEQEDERRRLQREKLHGKDKLVALAKDIAV